MRHHRTRIDPYGAENPAEFFAVVTEEFFELPARLHTWELSKINFLKSGLYDRYERKLI